MRRFSFILLVTLSLLLTKSSQSAFRFGFGKAVAERSATISNNVVSSGAPSLVLPVNSGDVVFFGSSGGIQPFGLPLESHPDGHPGIDFDCNIGAPVYASASGVVGSVIDSPIPQNPNQKSIGISHGSNYITFYTGGFKNILVSKDQTITKGQKIAEFDQWSQGSNYGSFHWGLRQQNPLVELCPYNYMAAADKTKLEQLHAQSTYTNKDKYPLICNPCVSPTGCR